MLLKAQEHEGLPKHTLLIDQPTRWSSTFTMLERFSLQKRAIEVASLDIDKFCNNSRQLLEHREWNLLPHVYYFFSYFLCRFSNHWCKYKPTL